MFFFLIAKIVNEVWPSAIIIITICVVRLDLKQNTTQLTTSIKVRHRSNTRVN